MQVIARAEMAIEEPHFLPVLFSVSVSVSVSPMSVELPFPIVESDSEAVFLIRLASAVLFKVTTSRALSTERSVALSIIAFIAI